jgi:hypothetical protein
LLDSEAKLAKAELKTKENPWTRCSRTSPGSFLFLSHVIIILFCTCVAHLFLSNCNTQKAFSTPEVAMYATNADYRQMTELRALAVRTDFQSFSLKWQLYDIFIICSSCAINNLKCSRTLCTPCTCLEFRFHIFPHTRNSLYKMCNNLSIYSDSLRFWFTQIK